MKPGLFILILFLSTGKCHSQPYANEDELLIANEVPNIFIVLRDDVAYFDRWGAKKNAVYSHVDTLIQQNDSLYLGRENILIKSNECWKFKKSDTSSYELNFSIASSEDYLNWTRLQNWLEYKKLVSKVEKIKSANIEFYNALQKELRQLYNIHYSLSINEYKESIIQTERKL